MIVLRGQSGRDVVVGETFRVLSAFGRMAEQAGPRGDEWYPDLYMVPHYEEALSDAQTERVRMQARAFLARHGARGVVREVLQNIIGEADTGE